MVFLLSAIIPLLSGCVGLRLALMPPGKNVVVTTYRIPATTGAPHRLAAGAARVDITPPPGYPTGGDGPAGNVARGYWTRLYARAFFFADEQGHTLVLVSCDLFAIPGGLSAMVARNMAVEKNAYSVVIPPEAVVIAATHTHQGPGNFLTAQALNAYASISGGFSRALLDYLTSQVTEAVRLAMRDALDNADTVSLSMHSAQITEQIQMNRSPRTFLLNWNSQALMNTLHPNPESHACLPDVETGEATHDWDLTGCPRPRAADPVMSVLAIHRGTTVVGMLVFFAVHPTVLDAAAPFNSADFTGYAMARLERETGGPSGPRPIAAFFNGAEGDVVAQRGRRDLIEAKSVGDTLVQAVRDVLCSPARMLVNPMIST